MKYASSVTLNLPDAEMRELSALCYRHRISKTGALRQALNLFLLVEARKAAGETLFIRGDQDREVLIAGVGLGDQS